MTHHRKLNRVLWLEITWLALLAALILWWGSVVLRQSEHIENLELAAGVAETDALFRSQKTTRMIYAEGAVMAALFAGLSGALFWLHWRDRKRVRSLQSFFATVTHDLKTPLTSVRLQAEAIAESTPRDSAVSTLAARLLEDSEKLEIRLERALELAHVERGGIFLARPTEIKSELDRLINTWTVAHSGRLAIEARIFHATALVDTSAFEIIFRNLLENSLRHSLKNPIQIVIESLRQDRMVWVTLRDNGGGFNGDPSLLGSLFMKGEQSSGTGVGLYLVRTLMRGMGGHAKFRNLGEGFECSLAFREAARGA